MGKRSNFERRPQDAYDTPYEAVVPLLPHLGEGARFIEPCAGRGDLIGHLQRHGHICVDSWDIEPRMPGLAQRDALTWRSRRKPNFFITNPPWTREILHPLIIHLANQHPTWLLFDADWAYTKQSAGFMPFCRSIVPVGRVKWIAGSKHTGKDNAAWYLFDRESSPAAMFYPRAA